MIKMLVILIMSTIFVSYINGEVFYKDSTFIVVTKHLDSDVNKEVVKKQLIVLQKIIECTNGYPLKIIEHDSTFRVAKIELNKHDNLIEYFGDFGLLSFSSDGLIKSYHSRRKCRDVTDQEMKYYNKNKNTLAPSIIKINQEKAISIAYNFFSNVLKLFEMQNDISVFDSVKVTYGDDRYIIHFIAKKKNHIPDNRRAEIAVSPLNGQILKFYTPDGLQLNVNINYKPEISYEKVKEIINSYIAEKNIDTKSEDITLRPRFRRFKWVWVLIDPYLKPGQMFSSYLAVDSSTGEVVYCNFSSADNKN